MIRFFAALLVAGLVSTPALAGTTDAAMYVWSTGFDAGVSGCDTAKLQAWDKSADPQCYTPTWDTPERRQWLWDTANRPGHEVGRLFVSGSKTRLQGAYLAGDCSDPDVQLVRDMLSEGHCQVPGVAIHALFSDSDAVVSEQNWIPYVVWYNDVCAADASERFDGVAINNEAWIGIRCSGDPDAERDYLDNLAAIPAAADLQQNGSLASHYSIGWHWGRCSGAPYELDWDGTLQSPTHHMIDIFDSVDVQVAFTSSSTVADRAQTAGYDHAVSAGKPFYMTSYTNKGDDAICQTTHFPYYCSYTWSNSRRSDDYLMQQIFGQFAAEGVPAALPSIHYFRGVYSSGGHVDWPSYASGSVAVCEAGPPPIPALPGTRLWLVVAGGLILGALLGMRSRARLERRG